MLLHLHLRHHIIQRVLSDFLGSFYQRSTYKNVAGISLNNPFTTKEGLFTYAAACHRKFLVDFLRIPPRRTDSGKIPPRNPHTKRRGGLGKEMVDLLERLDVMRRQEATSYQTIDYLSPSIQTHLASAMDDEAMVFHSSSSSQSSSSSCSSAINEIWREKICEWSYQVIDHFDFSREVVSVAIHYLDRYLSTRQVNKQMFQLAAMTCLFLAVKLYEPGKLTMSSMIELSRGYFSVAQMAAMETSMLRALSWHVHPPTAYCFAKHMLFLLPFGSIPMTTRHDVLELARFLAELSVIDYFFVVHRPSVVAMAAILNAMEDVPGASNALDDFTRELKCIRSDPDSEDVMACRKRLRLLYSKGEYSIPVGDAAKRDETISPVCVASYNHPGY